jgi:hypothetical protein
MDLTKVNILVLNWNGWSDTIECLESLQRLNYPDYRIVVIDNGSTDGSMEKIKFWAAGEIPVKSNYFDYDPTSKPVRWIEYDRATAEAGGSSELEAEIERLSPNRKMVLLQTGENLGFAGGNNVGIRYSMKRGADYIWLLNNDTIVDAEALLALINEIGSDRHIGMVGSKIFFYNRPNILWFAGGTINRFTGRTEHLGMRCVDSPQWSTAKDVDYVSGCSLLVSPKLIVNIGLMDESFFLYYEETDWATRAHSNGWRIRYQPSSKIWHKVSKSVGLNSPIMIYYFNRSALIYAKKHSKYGITLVLLSLFRYHVAPNIFRGKFNNALSAIKGMYSGMRKQTIMVVENNV